MTFLDTSAKEIIKVLAEGYGNVIALTNVAGAVAIQPPQVASIQTLTLGVNETFTFPAPIAGGRLSLILTQDGTGSRTGTWAATSGSVLFVGGSKTLTTTAGAVDRVAAESDGVNWYCSLNKAYA